MQRRSANAAGRTRLEAILRSHGFDIAGPAVGNFVCADAGGDATVLFDALLREGVIVRPLAGFGAPEAVRVTVGTPEDHEFLDQALAHVRAQAGVA